MIQKYLIGYDEQVNCLTVLVNREYSGETVVEGKQQAHAHNTCALTLKLNKDLDIENSGQAVVNVQWPMWLLTVSLPWECPFRPHRGGNTVPEPPVSIQMLFYGKYMILQHGLASLSAWEHSHPVEHCFCLKKEYNLSFKNRLLKAAQRLPVCHAEVGFHISI